LPNTEKTDSSIQTNSSITIEKIQSPVPPIINITKPKVREKKLKYNIFLCHLKVLGNITPFSWPKFARAQEEFAKKYPEKCRANDGMLFTFTNFILISRILFSTNEISRFFCH
jgi:hypothetical protein